MKRSKRLEALTRGGKGTKKNQAGGTATLTRRRRKATRKGARARTKAAEEEEEEVDAEDADDDSDDDADEVEERSVDADDDDADDEEDEDEDDDEDELEERALDGDDEDEDEDDEDEEDGEDEAPASRRRSARSVREEETAIVDDIVRQLERRNARTANRASRRRDDALARKIAKSVLRRVGDRVPAEARDRDRDRREERSSRRPQRRSGRGPAVASTLVREMPSRFKSLVDASRGEEAPVLDLTKKEIRAYSFARVLRGVLEGDLEGICPYELELSIEAMKVEGRSMSHLPPGMRRKNLATSPSSAGGILVPAQVLSAQIIPLLQSTSIAYSLGIMRMPGASGSPIYIPKITGGTTAYWVNHDTTDDPTAVTRSQPTFGQIRMEPHTLAAAVELSNRLIDLSSPAAEAIVRKQVARDMAIEVDRTVFDGTGADGQPIGILQQENIQATTNFGSAAAETAYDKFIDMITSMQSENVASGAFAWVMHPATFGKVRKMKDKSDNTQPKARRLIDEGAPQSILGVKYGVSTVFPTDKILFGAMDYCVAPEWGSMFVSIDSQAVNRKFTTSLLVGMELDFNITQDKAFHVALDVT